ncbi:MAG: efflux RND transporter periplasmic adaptor subunit [Coriobacteriia bacterium]
MKKKRVIAAVVALVVVAGVGACTVLQAQAAVPEVTVAPVEKGDLVRTVTVSGSTKRGMGADVYPPTAGTLAEVFVEEGDEVKAGDPLAVLDTEPLELQVAQAEAAYQAALAQVDTLEAQAPGDSDIAAAQTAADAAYDSYLQAAQTTKSLEDAVADLHELGIAESVDLGSVETTNPLVQDALNVLEQLDIEGVIAGVEGATLALLDVQVAQLQAAEDQAYAAYLQALGQVAALEGTDMSASLASARAACEQARLALELAEETLSEATMTAPIDGVVLFNEGGASVAGVDVPAATIGPGASVSPASPPFTIVQLDRLEFVGEVDEADVDSIEPGMKARVSLDAFPDREFETTVRKVGVESRLTATGGNAYEVFMDLSNTDERLLVGMRGSADIELATIGDAVSIPIEALFEDDEGPYVFLVDDGRLKRVPVKTGEFTETRVEIADGLQGDEEVVTSGAGDLSDGARVRVGEGEKRPGPIFGG